MFAKLHPFGSSHEQDRAVGRSDPGWGWAVYEHGKLSAKEAALWAERQAQVKQVSKCLFLLHKWQ